MPPSDDSQLLARAAAGDTLAFEALVDRYARAAYGFAYRILRNKEDAEDVVQASFSSLWRVLEKGSHPDVFWPFLKTTIRNNSINLLRGCRAPTASLDEVSANQEDEVGSVHRVPEALVVQAPDSYGEIKRAKLIRDWLLSCNQGTLEALLFVVFEEFTQQEASEILGASLGTVATRIRGAKAKLKQLLEGESGGSR